MDTTETRFQLNHVHLTALFVLRVTVGWHFLYEGLIKLLDPYWTSAGFLIESRWIFAGVFHWMAETPAVLGFVDFMNIWGLILIGLGLFFGCMTRIASLSGILLLFLYYMAIPPIPSIMDGAHTEGSYLIVNKNLVELIALCVLAILPGDKFLSIDGLLDTVRKRARLAAEENALDPSRIEGGPLSLRNVTRREIVKSMTAMPIFGAFIVSLARRHGWKSIEEKRLMEMVNGKPSAVTSATMKTIRFSNLKDLKGGLPEGRIGDKSMTRLIVGGNLISGFAHARDLIYVSPFLKQYFTDEKVIETLRICEACGINTAVLRTDMDTIRIINKYRKRGGNIQWLAQTYPSEEDPITNTQIALDNGAIGALIQGNIADNFVKGNLIHVLEKTISYIKGRGVIAGIAGHDLAVPHAMETNGIDVDFYMKTLHCGQYWSHQLPEGPPAVVDNTLDNYWCLDPEKTIGFMQEVKKPWIAYKVLAAGAIQPKVGFTYTFANGADFACVGMFDFQVIDNVNTTIDVLAGDLGRKRNWMA